MEGTCVAAVCGISGLEGKATGASISIEIITSYAEGIVLEGQDSPGYLLELKYSGTGGDKYVGLQYLIVLGSIPKGVGTML